MSSETAPVGRNDWKQAGTTPILFIWGTVTAIAGLIIRIYARRLTWPDKWEYSGSRENTIWAFNEQLFIDLSLIMIVFGLVLVLMGIWRVVR